MNLLASSILLLVSASVASAACPDFSFHCPTGGYFTVNTCFRWFQCQTCTDIITAIRKSKCEKYSCNGSVEKWYARNDGCSAPFVGKLVTQVFRAACAVHDMCYATTGRSKSWCDLEFLNNMKKTCNFPGIGNISRFECRALANTAYSAVLLLGKSSFNNAQTFAKSNCRKL